jgi:hypothetical protein
MKTSIFGKMTDWYSESLNKMHNLNKSMNASNVKGSLSNRIRRTYLFF